MSLRLLTASPTERLVATLTGRNYLGLGDSSQDATIQRILGAISGAFSRSLGYELPRQRWEEKVPGNGRARLILTPRPVDPDSVTVTVDDVAETDFVVENNRTLYRTTLWPTAYRYPGQEGQENVAATFKAGYVLAEYLSTWAALSATIASATTQWIRPSSPEKSPMLFEVTTAGTTGATEPTWPTTAGTTVTDGSAVLTARRVSALPSILEEACLATLASWWEEGSPFDVPADIQSERQGPVELVYRADPTGSMGLSAAVLAVLDAFR